jgi:hypothetical protein
MATKKEINDHLKKALKEIGNIVPWFDKEVNEWIFSHRLYPVEYGGQSKEEVIKNYPKYLREFIAHRLDNPLEHQLEKETQGRGGKRPGAGRPKGSKKTSPTKIVRLDVQIADWVKKHENDIYHLIAGDKKLVASKKVKRV